MFVAKVRLSCLSQAKDEEIEKKILELKML